MIITLSQQDVFVFRYDQTTNCGKDDWKQDNANLSLCFGRSNA